MALCQNCGAQLKGGEESCPKCGAEVVWNCGNCGAQIKGGTDFCPKCGNRIIWNEDEQSYTCGNCGGEFIGRVDFCPHCGTKINWEAESTFQWKEFGEFLVKFLGCLLLLGVIIFYTCSGDEDSPSEKTEKIVQEKIPTNLETVNVEQMLIDLSQNEMRAQKKYANKWFEIVGRLGSMDSEGEYFSLVGEALLMIDVHCKIPKDKREKLTNILAEMEKGERIAVKGKVVDMGEIMGYHVSIVEVYRKPE